MKELKEVFEPAGTDTFEALRHQQFFSQDGCPNQTKTPA